MAEGEIAKDHQSLARNLTEPASILCRVELAEGGGCHGECVIKDAASKASAFARASRLLEQLPRARDPETEADVAVVRDRAAEVARAFGANCQKAVASDALVTIETRACAHIYEQTWNSRGQLLDALATLRDAAKDRSGVELPNHRQCANP